MMSTNRIPLDDEMVSKVAGGNIQYVNNGTDRYCWGSHNPGRHYSFPSKKNMLNFIDEHYDELGERGCLEEMVRQGIIIPIN